MGGVHSELKLQRVHSMKGTFISDKIIISVDAKEIHDGLGEIINSNRELNIFEAMYLIDRQLIEIDDFDKKSFAQKCAEIDKRFWIKYRVFNDLKNRGYKFVRSGLKYGCDFRLYPREFKSMNDGHASHVIFCFSDIEQIAANHFSAMVRVANSTRKKLMIGIVDGEGSVTYYEIMWIRP